MFFAMDLEIATKQKVEVLKETALKASLQISFEQTEFNEAGYQRSILDNED